MATIEELVKTLNQLSKRWIVQKETFSEQQQFFEVIKSIREMGYSLSFPKLEFEMPIYDQLSDQGKHDFDQMLKYRKMKMKAIEKQEFERAADLRDLEKSLISKIQSDFSLNTKNEHFVLAGKMDDILMFNDPDDLLIALIK